MTTDLHACTVVCTLWVREEARTPKTTRPDLPALRDTCRRAAPRLDADISCAHALAGRALVAAFVRTRRPPGCCRCAHAPRVPLVRPAGSWGRVHAPVSVSAQSCGIDAGPQVGPEETR